ncbi:hypothetical protein V1503_19055 [Bacillus sp. SCS-151]|uniref:hypothetical protein n=1 Tax=Nanhaiella sioensis TaxID=3115293 RepID=UPI00397B8C11
MKNNFTGTPEKVPMTEGLLDLLCMIHDYKQFMISKSLFEKFHKIEPNVKWYDETEKFFNSLDSDVLCKYELFKNKISFIKVINFKITDDMMSTLSEDLPKKFTF